ncbi:MAG TPA: DUF6174 domain-containing protein [Gemmatimonadaceae bacterium]|nr:DUF6174 domain-containing protein [Gemmatimonadaceae bacterium]
MPRLLALPLLLLIACAPPAPEPARPADTAALPGIAELDRHASAWRASRPDAYAYRYRVDCFCPGGGRWYRVLVRRGEVVEVAAADTGVVGKGPPLAAGRVPTVDSLFTVARRAFGDGADSVAVEYDAAGHYPRRIYVDQRLGAADDEVTYQVDSLTMDR